MSSLEKKAEFFANIAIVLVALVLLAVAANRFWAPKEVPSVRGITIGEKVSIADINWAENKQTLLFVLQENCSYCTKSIPFYKKIKEKSLINKKTKLLALFPNNLESAMVYLKDQNLEFDDLRQADFAKLGVRGTPTLLLVDGQGTVIDSWIGKLQPEDEEKVLQKINCKEGTDCS